MACRPRARKPTSWICCCFPVSVAAMLVAIIVACSNTPAEPQTEPPPLPPLAVVVPAIAVTSVAALYKFSISLFLKSGGPRTWSMAEPSMPFPKIFLLSPTDSSRRKLRFRSDAIEDEEELEEEEEEEEEEKEEEREQRRCFDFFDDLRHRLLLSFLERFAAFWSAFFFAFFFAARFSFSTA